MAKAPDTITALAQSCVQFVETSVGVELDYTSETLPILDHYVRSVPERPNDELIGLLVPATGAYFGEVVRKTFEHVRWLSPEARYPEFDLQFERSFLHFNPLGIAYEAAVQDDVASWHAHFRVHPDDRTLVREALELSAEVAPEDYYRFAVRFDVIQHIIDILVGAAGGKERDFNQENYSAVHPTHADSE